MNVIIENGGLDTSLYQTYQYSNETEEQFKKRLRFEERKRCEDMMFFMEILRVINHSDTEEELRHSMNILFSERVKRNLHNQFRVFTYDFNGGTPEHDFEDVKYMEVWQAGNSQRLMYVELPS